eukprot:1156564-Pelagomonas_calceolata.AAC.2
MVKAAKPKRESDGKNLARPVLTITVISGVMIPRNNKVTLHTILLGVAGTICNDIIAPLGSFGRAPTKTRGDDGEEIARGRRRRGSIRELDSCQRTVASINSRA